MEESLTYEKVLQLIAETELSIKRTWEESEKRAEKRAEERAEKRRKEEEKRRKEEEKRRKEVEKQLDESKKQLDEELKKSREEFEKRLHKLDGKFGNILGSFVESMVEPGLIQLFQQRGIPLREIHRNVIIYNDNNEKEAEFDLLLVNSNYSMAVEVKTTLTVEDVNDHIQRLDKLQKFPIRTVRHTHLCGAVAGMKIAGHADRYAYRKGLFVLRQKGEIAEIANDERFQPREWLIE